jgi:hypothetical protein
MWAERLRDGEQILIRPIRAEDREELAAVEPDTEHGIGVARFVRSPADGDRAEVAWPPCSS